MSEVFLGNPGTSRKVIFGEPTGFCGGVMGADALTREVATAAEPMGIPVFGYHAIVHNNNVVDEHRRRGVEFVDDVNDVPEYSAAIVSAHGASPEVFVGLEGRNCEVFDATCPLVGKTHKGIQAARTNGEKVIYLCKGKPGEVEHVHDEVVGAVGHMDYYRDDQGQLVPDPVERAYVELDDEFDVSWLDQDESEEGGAYRIISQTTLDAEKVLAKMKVIKADIQAAQEGARVEYAKTSEVCLAVSERQKAVRNLLDAQPDRMIVVTDPTSKNGKGYVQLAHEQVAATGSSTEVIQVKDSEDAALKLGGIEGTTVIVGSASTPNGDMKEVARLIDPDATFESTDLTFNLQHGRPKAIRKKLANLAAQRALAGL